MGMQPIGLMLLFMVKASVGPTIKNGWSVIKGKNCYRFTRLVFFIRGHIRGVASYQGGHIGGGPL